MKQGRRKVIAAREGEISRGGVRKPGLTGQACGLEKSTIHKIFLLKKIMQDTFLSLSVCLHHTSVLGILFFYNSLMT